MSKRVLITGSTGFIGTKLVQTLKQNHFEVDEWSVELTDSESVLKAFDCPPWDIVIHLGGMSHVPSCEADPDSAFNVNTNGTKNLVRAIRQFSPKSHLIFASTAQVYSAASETELESKLVISEEREISPQNVYAQTKWEAEKFIREASDEWGLSGTIFRLFNFTHHSQSPKFFLPYLYSQLSQAPKDKTLTLPVGNLDLERDLGAIPDLLSAFVSGLNQLPLQNQKVDVFNLCSGSSRNLRVLAIKLAQLLGVNAEFVFDPTRARSGEPKSVCGSYEKFASVTGWQPQYISDEDFLASFLTKIF